MRNLCEQHRQTGVIPRTRLACVSWVRIVAAFTIPAVAGVPHAAWAQLPANATMSDAVAAALRGGNVDLRVARLQIDSAAGERRIARALPNPTFAVTPGTPFQYGVTEPIDIGPARYYRGRAADLGVTAVRHDADDVARQVTFAVRQAWLDLQLAEANRAAALAQDTIVRALLAADSVRVAEGDLARRELSTVEIQFAHAEAQLARANAADRAARIALQVLIGVEHPDTAFHPADALVYRPLRVPFDSLEAIALVTRPDLAASGSRVAQGQALHATATAALVPVPGLAAVYQPTPFGNGSRYAVGLSLGLPLLDWFGGERQRAAAGVQAAVAVNEHARRVAAAEVTAAADDFRAAQTLAARYAGGLLDKARATLEMQRFAYDHGDASLLDLLNAVADFSQTETDYYGAVHDYWAAAYAIDRAVGRDVVQ